HDRAHGIELGAIENALVGGAQEVVSAGRQARRVLERGHVRLREVADVVDVHRRREQRINGWIAHAPSAGNDEPHVRVTPWGVTPPGTRLSIQTKSMSTVS